MLPNLQNLSLFFFTLQTQRKKAAFASHTQNLPPPEALTIPNLPPSLPLGLPSAAAWSSFSALSFSLSFHYESVFYSVLICYFTKSMWVFIVFCTIAPVWFYLLIFFAEFLNLGPCVWLCVGAVVLRTVLWTSDICCWVTQLEFWVSKVWLCVWLCVGLWG